MSIRTPLEKRARLRPINSETIRVLEDGFLRCGLCMKMMEEPKSLECLHKFCEGCLQQYIATRKTLRGQSFTCPNGCATKTRLPEDGVPGLRTDFTIQGIQSVLKKRKSSAVSVQTLFQQQPVDPAPHNNAAAAAGDDEEEDSDYEEPVPSPSLTPPDAEAALATELRRSAPAAPGAPSLPPKSSNLRRNASAAERDIQQDVKDTDKQLAWADHKMQMCEEAIKQFNVSANNIIDDIAKQEQILIQDIKQKCERMRSRAMQILDSEEIKLRRTMEETQVIRTNLHDFRQHAQIAIRNGTKLEHARVSASDQRSLQQPVNELSLAVQRTAQRDRPLFNLLVQKTELKAVRHTRPRQAPPTHPKPKPPTQSAQDAQHFRCPPTPPTAAVAAPTPAQRRPPTRPRGGRGSPPSSTASPPGRQNSNESMDFIVQRENMWFVADTEEDPDEATDRWLGLLANSAERDSGYQDDQPRAALPVMPPHQR